MLWVLLLVVNTLLILQIQVQNQLYYTIIVIAYNIPNSRYLYVYACLCMFMHVYFYMYNSRICKSQYIIQNCKGFGSSISNWILAYRTHLYIIILWSCFYQFIFILLYSLFYFSEIANTCLINMYYSARVVHFSIPISTYLLLYLCRQLFTLVLQ